MFLWLRKRTLLALLLIISVACFLFGVGTFLLQKDFYSKHALPVKQQFAKLTAMELDRVFFFYQQQLETLADSMSLHRPPKVAYLQDLMELDLDTLDLDIFSQDSGWLVCSNYCLQKDPRVSNAAEWRTKVRKGISSFTDVHTCRVKEINTHKVSSPVQCVGMAIPIIRQSMVQGFLVAEIPLEFIQAQFGVFGFGKYGSLAISDIHDNILKSNADQLTPVDEAHFESFNVNFSPLGLPAKAGWEIGIIKNSDALTSNLIHVSVVFSALALLLILFFGLILLIISRMGLQPIQEFSKALRFLKDGQYYARLSQLMHPEIQKIADSIRSEVQEKIQLRKKVRELNQKVGEIQNEVRVLEELEREFHSIFAENPFPLAIIDLNSGHIVESNREFEALQASGKNSASKNSIGDLIALQKADVNINLSAPISETQKFPHEPQLGILHRESGDRVFVDVYFRSIVYAQKHHLVVVLHDNSEKRIMSEQLAKVSAESEKINQYKDTFLMKMTDSLREPINSLSERALKLIAEVPVGPMAGMLEDMHFELYRLLEQLRDMTDYAELEAGMLTAEPHVVNFVKILDEIENRTRKLCGIKRISYHTQRDPKLPEFLESDFPSLQRILEAIVFNAVDNIHSGNIYMRALLAGWDGEEARIRMEIIHNADSLIDSNRNAMALNHGKNDERDPKAQTLGVMITHALLKKLGGDMGSVTSMSSKTYWIEFSANIPTNSDSSIPAAISETIGNLVEENKKTESWDKKAALELFGNNEMILKMSAEKFYSQTGSQLENLRQSIAAGNREDVAKIAHKMAGGAGSLALKTLARIAKTIENQARDTNDELDSIFESLAAEWQSNQVHLQNFIEQS